jgi:uncharacterized protein YdhG (YjbR/CyaY superfamily)
MQRFVKDVDSYIREIPGNRKAALEKLRNLFRSVLTDYEESMEYGMPVYKRNNIAEAGFASQKNYISIYIMRKDALDKYRDILLKGASIGKGCIRYAKPEKINYDIIEKTLQASVTDNGPIC